MESHSLDDKTDGPSGTRPIFKLLGFLLVAGAVSVIVLAVWFVSMLSNVMTKRSPDGLHTARLQRIDGIDLMFELIVDGTRVYRSPDFAPSDDDFREHIYWSSDSRSVVLEVAGRRLFGYHVTEKRELTVEELEQIPLTPFEELGYEGD